MISGFVEKWTLKWKCSETSFRINRRDTELRFVTKFGENRPLQSCRKVTWFTKRKNSGAPILAKMGRSLPKFPESCHPLTFLRTPNLVRIGCVLPDLLRRDWYFGPKIRYNNYRLSAYKKDSGKLAICPDHPRRRRRVEVSLHSGWPPVCSFIRAFLRISLELHWVRIPWRVRAEVWGQSPRWGVRGRAPPLKLIVFACPKEAVNLPHYWYLQKSVNHTVNEWVIV